MKTHTSLPSPLWGEEGARAERGKVRGFCSCKHNEHSVPLTLTLSPKGRGNGAR